MLQRNEKDYIIVKIRDPKKRLTSYSWDNESET